MSMRVSSKCSWWDARYDGAHVRLTFALNPSYWTLIYWKVKHYCISSCFLKNLDLNVYCLSSHACFWIIVSQILAFVLISISNKLAVRNILNLQQPYRYVFLWLYGTFSCGILHQFWLCMYVVILQQMEKSPLNIKSLLKRLYSLAAHPSAFKRLGSSLAFNNIYDVFRSVPLLVHILDCSLCWFAIQVYLLITE